jgi:hypothetical protein
VKHVIVIAVLCTLPLRIWAAECTELASEQLTAAGSPAPVLVMADCPMAKNHPTANDESNLPSSKKSCQSCQLCMPFNECPAQLSIASQEMPSLAPSAGLSSFISFLLTPRQKPPIA